MTKHSPFRYFKTSPDLIHLEAIFDRSQVLAPHPLSVVQSALIHPEPNARPSPRGAGLPACRLPAARAYY
jgi:hypothetical protein